MGYGTNGLTFNTLRGANVARLPEFKNKHGAPAHSQPDGSDWSPAQWLQATLGELGEFAQVRIDFEAGKLTRADYRMKAGKELADVVTYLDILARRCMDQLDTYTDEGVQKQGHAAEDSSAQILMRLLANLGAYANDRKKLERGDHTATEYSNLVEVSLAGVFDAWSELNTFDMDSSFEPNKHPGDKVAKPHAIGVDLGAATMSKFNEVSERVGSRVFVDADDWHYRGAAPYVDRRTK